MVWNYYNACIGIITTSMALSFTIDENWQNVNTGDKFYIKPQKLITLLNEYKWI